MGGVSSYNQPEKSDKILEDENQTPLFVFNKAILLNQLRQLHETERSAFAAACAQRLLPFYLAFSKRTGRGDPKELSNLLALLWDDLAGILMSETELDAAIQACMKLIPREDDGPWVYEQRLADDSASALAYALRCRKNGQAQEAGWAAERAYEAVMYFCDDVRRQVSPARKARLLNRAQDLAEIRHRTEEPVVQSELERQQRDLEELLNNKEITLEQLKERSIQEAAQP